MTYCSTFEANIPEVEKHKYNRSLRYSRLKVASRIGLMTGHSVATCMKSMIGPVRIKLNVSSGRSFFSGLATCGSVWDCPVCSAKISTLRTLELREGINNWISSGGSVAMVTYTLSHHMGDTLKDLSSALTEGIRMVHNGAPYKRIKEKYGIKGTVTATEVLYNRVNGWHVHKHVLFFFKGSQKVDTSALKIWIYNRYEKALELRGYHSSASVGVDISDLTSDTEDLPEYISKWGLENELASNIKDSSSGLSPFQLLDTPDTEKHYIEYSKAMRGKRRLVWSKGLRDLCGLGLEKSDIELAEGETVEDLTEVIITISSGDLWRYIIQHDLRSDLLDHSEEGLDHLITWLNKILPEDLYDTLF